MKTQTLLKFDSTTISFPLAFVLLMWFVFWVEVNFGVNFNDFGVAPKSFVGLRGIIFSPFIHGDIEHLYSNTLPVLILSMALLYFYREIAWKVLGVGLMLSGLLTWIIAKQGSVHIGASGMVYLMTSFLFFKGIWSKNYRLTALSLIVVFVYGSLVWGVFPGEKGISWEGHLSGFLIGVALAFYYKSYNHLPVKKYEWEKPTYREEEDEFMKHFDENGNFIPSSEMDNTLMEEESNGKDNEIKPVKIYYHFVGKKNTKSEE